MIKRLTIIHSQQLKDLRILSLQTDPLSFLSTHEREKDFPLEFFENKISLNTKENDFGYWGYFDGDTLLGYCLLSQQYLPKTKHIADFFELYIHPDYRNKQLATSLLQHCIETCRSNTIIEYIYLETNNNNTLAMSLYEKNGFEKVLTRKNGIKLSEGEYLDVVFYVQETTLVDKLVVDD